MAEATPRPLPVAAVLFDLDGTLVDTAPDLAAALNRVRVDRGLDPLPYAALRPFSSHGARGLVGAGFAVAPEHAGFAALRDAFLAHYEAALCVYSAVFDGIDAVLVEIERRGLPWGIVTNKIGRFTLPLLDRLCLTTRAATIVCGDTTPHAKPHPAPLLHAARALGIAPDQCVYVGDAARDIDAGVAAGMPAIVARYGYLEPHDAPETWPAIAMIDRPAELLLWLPARPGGA